MGNTFGSEKAREMFVNVALAFFS